MSPNEMALQENHLTSTTISNRHIANYKLVELRGSGGMANIFKAIQLSLERPVALKIMHPHLVTNETFVARFEKEAKRAAVLQHENIVAIIDYGCDGSEYYIAMEYIDGTNLVEILKKQRIMPLEICLHVCHEVVEGLKYAHGQGIVHRDIKPANIMLSYDGRVMLTDFGIAKADGDMSITSTGQVIGSPAYMSPEQAAGKTLDHRSDIFSLGIILYEMIAGEKPFKGETYQSMVASIMADIPAPLPNKRAEVTPEINSLALKALEKSADSRFQSAEDFSEAIAAQLSKFKIPSSRKMMSEYLKNPIRVTDRLREDKVSDHMESGMYFLAVGEGKLAEARREFQEVLRFDKKNKEARKYLVRLESAPSLNEPDDKPARRLNARIVGVVLAAVGIVFLVGLVFIFAGRKGTAIADRDSSLPVSGAELSTQKPGAEIPISANLQQDGNGSNKTSNAESNKSSVKTGEKQLADKNGGKYNYPDQKLVRFGTLRVVTGIPAKLTIGGRDYGWTGGPPIKLSPGRHIVEVEAEGYRKVSRRVFIRRGEDDLIGISLEPTVPSLTRH